MSRLRKMREKREIRDDQAIQNLMDRVKASGRANRMDWFKGQMRWFVGSTHAAKIKANIEVEKSLGCEQPDLWLISKDAEKSGRFSIKESREYAKLVNTGSHPALPADPLLEAEKEYLAAMAGLPPGGKVDSAPKLIETTKDHAEANEAEAIKRITAAKELMAVDEQTAVVKHEKKAGVRRLRLMQIHQRKCDIEVVAEDVIADIQLICVDREASKSEQNLEKWNAGLHLVEEKGEAKQSAATRSETKNDADENYVPPSPDSIAIWG